jgi:hypothetical protein
MLTQPTDPDAAAGPGPEVGTRAGESIEQSLEAMVTTTAHTQRLIPARFPRLLRCRARRSNRSYPGCSLFP